MVLMLFNFFFFVIDAQDKNAKEFIRRIFFQASQKFVSKSEVYISRLRVVLLASIGTCLKNISKNKDPCIFVKSVNDEEKKFYSNDNMMTIPTLYPFTKK
jgi:hypothetical protein